MFLDRFAAERAPDEHAALVLDQAGWHDAHALRVPDNLTLVPLPPHSPELNPVERVWLHLRERFLSHRLLSSYDAIVDAGCAAWKRLTPKRLRFAPAHDPARYAAGQRLERSAIGGVFAVLTMSFGSPLPWHSRADLPVVVDVRPEGAGVAWTHRLGSAGVIRSIKSAGPRGTVLECTDGGLGMVLDVMVEGVALVFTRRSFLLAVGRWRVPVPAWVTPVRCRVEHPAARIAWTQPPRPTRRRAGTSG